VRLLSRKVTSGVLRVTVHRAELTIDTEMFGKMDPFVTFEMKQADGMKPFEHKTKVHDGAGKKPVWNETFDVPVTNCHLNLKFTIKDKDVLSSDLIGIGSLTPSIFTQE
jgi:Ca2+-dependent lipid-binding protein